MNLTIGTNGIAYEEFDDEIVLINLPQGCYYSLRGVARFIFKILIDCGSVEYIASQLVSSYNISKDEAEKDTTEFIQLLQSHSLIVPTNKQPSLILEMEDDLYKSPDIEVYDDMKELLVLDPVHEVDQHQGWPIKK